MPTQSPPILPPKAERLRRLDALGRLLDDSIPIPGTGRRIGWDALIGLIPGIGDGAGAVLSAYIVAEAVRFGVPRSVLVRMAANVGIEALIGAVPFIGDLFDAAWKANLRNLSLLHSHLDSPRPVKRASRGWVVGVGIVLALVLFGAAAVAVWIGATLLGALGVL